MTIKQLGLVDIIQRDTPFNFEAGLGDYTIEQLRQICQEAIACGEAHERDRKQARRRLLKFILLMTIIAAAGATAVVFFSSIIR